MDQDNNQGGTQNQSTQDNAEPVEQKQTAPAAEAPAAEASAAEAPAAEAPAAEAPAAEAPAAEAPAAEAPAAEAPAAEAPAAEAPAAEAPAAEAPAAEEPAEEAPAVEAPAAEEPAAEAPAAEAPAAEAPAAEAPAAEAPAAAPIEKSADQQRSITIKQTVQEADWDNKRMQLNKQFYKVLSPRIFGYALSFEVDVDRAFRACTKKGYQVAEKPMILDKSARFFGNVLIEVTGVTASDKKILSFEGKEVYTKVLTPSAKSIQATIANLPSELGKTPTEIYTWWVSATNAEGATSDKAILIAVI